MTAVRRPAPRQAPRRRRDPLAGSCASCSPRSAPTSASAPRSLMPLIFVVALWRSRRRAGGGRRSAAHAQDRPGHPARAAAVRLDLAVPADHLAGGRATSSPTRTRTARSRRSSRARSSAGRSSRRRCSRRCSYAAVGLATYVGTALVLGGLAFGLRPADAALGHDGQHGPRPGAARAWGRSRTGSRCSRSPAIGLLLSTVTRNTAAAVVGTLMISILMQVLGIAAGARALQPYLLDRSSTPGRACCATRPTGTRSSGPPGSRRCTRCRRCSARYRVPAARRDRRLNQDVLPCAASTIVLRFLCERS